MVKKHKVCIIGAEPWGSAIATAVGTNVLNDMFDTRLHMYVYDELVRSNYLSEVINDQHENIKYLPGIKLPENLIAVNDLLEAAENADILIFATQAHFIKSYCNLLAGNIKSTAFAISMIKGLDHVKAGEIELFSQGISKQLKIPCYSMMCANSAMEMGQGKLCEITIGCNNAEHTELLTAMFGTTNCKVVVLDDIEGVELCGTLKDIIALGAGLIDGLRLGDNARVTALHLGLKEMMRFIKSFYPKTKLSTFFESCGVAHSVASCYSDKNVTFAKNFVTSGKTMQELEENSLCGRKLLGPMTAEEVYTFLRKQQKEESFPLFTAIHKICQNEVPPESLLNVVRNHPDLSNLSISEMLQKEQKAFQDNEILAAEDVELTHNSVPLDNTSNSNTKRVPETLIEPIEQQRLQVLANQKWPAEVKVALHTKAEPNEPQVRITLSTDEPKKYATIRDSPQGNSAKGHQLPKQTFWLKDAPTMLYKGKQLSTGYKEPENAWYDKVDFTEEELAYAEKNIPDWLTDNEWQAENQDDKELEMLANERKKSQLPSPVHEALMGDEEHRMSPFHEEQEYKSLNVRATTKVEGPPDAKELATSNQQSAKAELPIRPSEQSGNEPLEQAFVPTTGHLSETDHISTESEAGEAKTFPHKNPMYDMRLRDYEPQLVCVSERSHFKDIERMERELEKMHTKSQDIWDDYSELDEDQIDFKKKLKKHVSSSDMESQSVYQMIYTDEPNNEPIRTELLYSPSDEEATPATKYKRQDLKNKSKAEPIGRNSDKGHLNMLNHKSEHVEMNTLEQQESEHAEEDTDWRQPLMESEHTETKMEGQQYFKKPEHAETEDTEQHIPKSELMDTDNDFQEQSEEVEAKYNGRHQHIKSEHTEFEHKRVQDSIASGLAEPEKLEEQPLVQGQYEEKEAMAESEEAKTDEVDEKQGQLVSTAETEQPHVNAMIQAESNEASENKLGVNKEGQEQVAVTAEIKPPEVNTMSQSKSMVPYGNLTNVEPPLGVKEKRKQVESGANMRYYSLDKESLQHKVEDHEWDWLRQGKANLDDSRAKNADRLPEFYANEDAEHLTNLKTEAPEITTETGDYEQNFDPTQHSFLPQPVYNKVPEKVRDPQTTGLPQQPEKSKPDSKDQPRTVPPPSPQTPPLTLQPPLRKETPTQLEGPPQSSKSNEVPVPAPAPDPAPAPAPAPDSKSKQNNEEKPMERKENYVTKTLKRIMRRGQRQYAKAAEQLSTPLEYQGEFRHSRRVAKRASELEIPSTTRDSSKRRRVAEGPPFYPPINPRVRTPRPPFDGRDHEYHTMTNRQPPDLWQQQMLRSNPAQILLVKPSAATPKLSLSASCRTSAVANGPVSRLRQHLPPRTPVSATMMRCCSLAKVLCLMQLGMLAALLTCSKQK